MIATVLLAAGLFGDLMPAIDNALEYGRKIGASRSGVELFDCSAD